MFAAAVMNAAAAFNLTATKVLVEDVTVDKDNFFVTVEAHTSSGEYEVGFDVWPATHSVIGSFSAEDKTIGYVSSFVHKTKANGSAVNMWYNCDEDAVITLTITKKDDATCTLSGKIQATRKGTTYTYIIGDFDFEYSESGGSPEPAKDPYRFEPTDATTINFIGDVVAFKQKSGFINITLNEIENETYDWIELNLLSDELAWPAGDYAITNSGEAQTLTASRGYIGTQNDDPCYVAIRNGDWGQYTPYYLESGTLHVAYNTKTDSIFVTGTAVSHNGTTVNIDVKSLNALYNPDDEPKEPEFVTLAIDSVVITYMREESDAEHNEHHYTFNFFNKTDEYPNVLVDAILSEGLQLVAGTYTMADNELSGIMLFQNQSDFNTYFFGGEPYVFESVSMTLTDAGNGKWTYAMLLKDDIGSEYDFSFTQAPHIINYPDPDKEKENPEDVPFADELKDKVSLTAAFDSIRWEDKTVLIDGVLDIFLFQRTADAQGLRAAAQLGFYTPATEVPAGTYPINGTEENYTFSASVGRYGNVLIPCYITLIDDDDWVHAIWYIVDGEITLAYDTEGKVLLSGECTSYFGSTIAFSFASQATRIEDTSDTRSTRKVLRNGNIYILREGKVYDLTGKRL